MAATAVANALNDGDFEAFADLVDVLRVACQPKTANFVLAIIWALLPDEAQDDAMQGTYAVFLLCTPTSIMPAEHNGSVGTKLRSLGLLRR
jgi:hypothetical protein